MAFSLNAISSQFDLPQVPLRCAEKSIEQILNLSKEVIFKKGIPLTLIQDWADRFYHGLDVEQKNLMKLSRDDAWAYDERFFEDLDTMQLKFEKNGSMSLQKVDHKQYFIDKFYLFKFPEFWKDFDAHFGVFLQLYRIHKVVVFTFDDPVEKVFLKLMDCLMDKIVEHHPDLQGKEFIHFKLPDSENHKVASQKRLCCFKTSNEGWLKGDFNDFPNATVKIAQFDLNHTKTLILGKENQVLPHPRIVIEASIRPDAKGELQHLMRFNIVLYYGVQPLSNNQNNALSFTFDVNLEDPLFTILRFRQFSAWTNNSSELIQATEFNQIKEEVAMLFESSKHQLISLFKSGGCVPIAFEWLPPQTSTDRLWVLRFLLEELNKDADSYQEEIAWLAEEMSCTFSEQEIQELEKKDQAHISQGDVEISTKAVANKLCEMAQEQLRHNLLIDMNIASDSSNPVISTQKLSVETETTTVSICKSSSTPVKLEDEHTKIMQEQKLAKEIEKKRKREAYHWEKKKAEAKANDTSSSQDASCSSLFTLSFKDRRKVESIYKGQPMKAKEFTTFAMSLLRKKGKSEGVTISSNTVGAHPKLHFKRSDGSSGGVTFHFQHGRDDHGNLSAQKETLRRILGW